jgi:hypothetical protein
MSQKVNAVPDPAFSVPPLTTTAGTRVSRRRIKVPCNYPGTKYSHNGQSQFPTVVTFDVADNESFLDIDKSMIVLDFTPTFFNNQINVQSGHPIGFDGSSQSLMARVRIGNSQGLIIEELQAYGTWSNIMDAYSRSSDEVEHHLLDISSSDKTEKPLQSSFGSCQQPQGRLDSHVKRRLFLRFKQSSFLKSCRMIPLFLMRNGLRFEIEFEDVYKSLTRSLSARWQGPYAANVHSPNTSLAIGGQTARLSDWYFIRNGTVIDMVIKSNSQLSQALSLAERLIQNYNPSINLNNDVASPVAVDSQKFTGSWSIPMKFEYTDDFGVSKVLFQGIFHIRSYPRMVGANGIPIATDTDTLLKQYVCLVRNLGIAAEHGVNLGISLGDAKQLCFIARFQGAYEGNRDLYTSTTAEQAFLPYSNSNLRVYFDESDIAYVPDESAAGNSVALVGSSYATNFTNAAGNGLTNEAVVLSDFDHKQQPRYSPLGVGSSTWNYSIENVEMICDFVKPSSEVFLQFQQSFQAPAGIPYAYKRVLYHTRVLNPSEGLQQISLPIAVRSLRGIVCVLSDKLAWSRSSDNSSKSFNSLSAFMKRGLVRAQLVIGGQNYPSYDLNLTENGVEQIPEMECLFNVAGLGSFNPSFDARELQSTRNYLVGMGYSESGNGPYDGGFANNALAAAQGISEYQDTSKFVLGISTMKKDGDFVTGVDTSQAGSVSLNLYFKRQPDLANMFPGDYGSNRDIFVQVFCLADAVFTLQNDANLVRY